MSSSMPASSAPEAMSWRFHPAGSMEGSVTLVPSVIATPSTAASPCGFWPVVGENKKGSTVRVVVAWS